MDFSLKRTLPHAYHLHFEDHYQLAMHFLRLQEYYEGPKFADKIFTIVEYMEWYAKEYGDGIFTYPKDWSGFNVPDWVVEKVYGSVLNVPDFNPYDDLMTSVFSVIKRHEGKDSWYLIGTSSQGYKGDGDEAGVLDHELAHAMYYTDAKYRKDVESLLTPAEKNSHWYHQAWRFLKKEGYHERTIRDEIQAHAATGPSEVLKDTLTYTVREPFIANYHAHLERCRSQV